MRAVLTRVASASVSVEGAAHAGIGKGLLVLLGVGKEDSEREAIKMADRICGIRIFEDETGKMNVSPKEAGAEILIVSQFTLYGDCRSRRPGFTSAARPVKAKALYELCTAKCRENGFTVATGKFGADMQVLSQNDGPVTLIIDTDDV